MRRRVTDENIPGTLNVGHALPVVIEALIFISVVAVDLVTLVTMIGAAVIGAWLGVGVVSRLPKRAIQIGMGLALLVAGALFAAKTPTGCRAAARRSACTVDNWYSRSASV